MHSIYHQDLLILKMTGIDGNRSGRALQNLRPSNFTARLLKGVCMEVYHGSWIILEEHQPTTETNEYHFD